jgi:thiol-disulfide isomerase/thioredoxin
MKHRNPFRPAPNRACLIAAVVALSAGLGIGCAAKEPPAASSALPASASDAIATAGTSPERGSSSASPAQASSEATASSSISVEPVSPEEYQKFIARQRGKVVFVDFWATYCLPCREKFPRTLALARKYAGQGLTAVSMSMDSPEPSYQKQILEFLKKQNSQIKNLANRLEDTDAAFAALDILGGALPHYKIYGRNGKLRNNFGGDPDHPYDDADIERALIAALSEH